MQYLIVICIIFSANYVFIKVPYLRVLRINVAGHGRVISLKIPIDYHCHDLLTRTVDHWVKFLVASVHDTGII